MKRPMVRIVLFVLAIFVFGSCKKGDREITTPTGLRYTVLKAGSGRQAAVGDEVIIRERLEYPDGTLLYTTEGRGVNLPRFTLGLKQVIDGVDEGVRGMQVGEIRKLVVPPSLSKREEYPDFLSPDSTLVYTIEMVTIL